MDFGAFGVSWDPRGALKVAPGVLWRPEASWGPLGGGAENLKALQEGPRGLGTFPDRAPEGSLKCILDVRSIQKRRIVGTMKMLKIRWFLLLFSHFAPL